jgi:hypothetical protein
MAFRVNTNEQDIEKLSEKMKQDIEKLSEKMKIQENSSEQRFFENESKMNNISVIMARLEEKINVLMERIK